ncbi:hypothetical protein ISS42_02430 [Candidatus Shapirobacteria bacterium]|nr:hypothetical protein [Candidatus Shapirobacteria bacterium]
MKLNLGCGPFFKKGYVNLDAFDSTVAQKKALAWRLPYRNSSIEEVLASQLVEHLGYLATVFSFWEWHRVLKNGGKLIVETVDFQKTIRGLEKDKNLKHWLFGKEKPGMTHQYCFDQDELQKILKATGFSEVKVQKKTILDKPVLRFEVAKKESPGNNFLARLRQLILKKGLIDLKRAANLDFDREAFLEWLENNLTQKNFKVNYFKDLLRESLIFDPRLAALMLECLPLEFSSQLKNYGRVIPKLVEKKFPAYLGYLFYRIPKAAGFEKIVFNRVKKAAREYLNFLVDKIPLEKSSFAPLIYQRPNLPSFLQRPETFSLESLRDLSFLAESKAIAAWCQGKKKTALGLFKRAIKLHSGAFFSYWNLARMNLVKNNLYQAIIYYEKAWEVVPPDLEKELEKEIGGLVRNNQFKKYCQPKENVYY